MATTADIKIGMCIELDGKTFQIVDFQHVKPGKGPAFVRTKLKNLENGRVLDNTFSAGVKIEPVRVERRPYQFTYEDDLGMHFMHTETFEEINIDKNLINNYDLMADGQIVEVMFHTEKETVLSAELPPIVDMEVTYTEPGIYTYTIEQIAGLNPLCAYDPSVYHLKVSVTNAQDGSGLTAMVALRSEDADEKLAEAMFTNRYGTSPVPRDSNPPKTGDESNILLYGYLALVSIAGLVVSVVIQKRGKRRSS